MRLSVEFMTLVIEFWVLTKCCSNWFCLSRRLLAFFIEKLIVWAKVQNYFYYLNNSVKDLLWMKGGWGKSPSLHNAHSLGLEQMHFYTYSKLYFYLGIAMKLKYLHSYLCLLSNRDWWSYFKFALLVGGPGCLLYSSFLYYDVYDSLNWLFCELYLYFCSIKTIFSTSYSHSCVETPIYFQYWCHFHGHLWDIWHN